MKCVYDETSKCYYYVSEAFAQWLKENFAKLLDGETLYVGAFEGQLRECYINKDLQIIIRECKEEM